MRSKPYVLSSAHSRGYRGYLTDWKRLDVTIKFDDDNRNYIGQEETMALQRIQVPCLFLSLRRPQLLRIPDAKPMLKHLTHLLQRQARHLGIEEDDHDPADAADGSLETNAPDGVSPFIMVRNVDDTIMLGPQLQQVIHMVPMARTSIGKKSVLIHGTLPTDRL